MEKGKTCFKVTKMTIENNKKLLRFTSTVLNAFYKNFWVIGGTLGTSYFSWYVSQFVDNFLKLNDLCWKFVLNPLWTIFWMIFENYFGWFSENTLWMICLTNLLYHFLVEFLDALYMDTFQSCTSFRTEVMSILF